jgi:tRNA uridine 5-carboxymethylaminomethyl modification enzyme
LSEESFKTFEEKRNSISRLSGKLKAFALFPTAETNAWISARGLATLKDRATGENFIKRPEIQLKDLAEIGFDLSAFSEEVIEQVEIQTKYEGYIRRDMDLMESVRKNEELRIPSVTDYELVPGLSTEIRGKFSETRPETIGQASRMSGVTPAAVANLMIYLKMNERADLKPLERFGDL